VIKINTNSSPFSSLYQIFYRAYNYLVAFTFSASTNTFWFFFYSELLAFQFVLKYNKSAFCILSATHWLNASHRVDFLCPFAGPSTPISLCVLTWKILIIFYVNCKRPRPKSCNRSNRNIFGLINWKMCVEIVGREVEMGNRCGNGHRRGWFRASLNAKSNVKGITIGGDKDNRWFSLFPTLFFLFAKVH